MNHKHVAELPVPGQYRGRFKVFFENLPICPTPLRPARGRSAQRLLKDCKASDMAAVAPCFYIRGLRFAVCAPELVIETIGYLGEGGPVSIASILNEFFALLRTQPRFLP